MISIIFPPAIMGEKMSYWNIRPFLASCACSRMAGSTNRAAELYATLVMIGRRSAGVRGEKVRTLFTQFGLPTESVADADQTGSELGFRIRDPY